MGTMRPGPLPSAVSHGLWVGLTVASAPFSVTNPRRSLRSLTKGGGTDRGSDKEGMGEPRVTDPYDSLYISFVGSVTLGSLHLSFHNGFAPLLRYAYSLRRANPARSILSLAFFMGYIEEIMSSLSFLIMNKGYSIPRILLAVSRPVLSRPSDQ